MKYIKFFSINFLLLFDIIYFSYNSVQFISVYSSIVSVTDFKALALIRVINDSRVTSYGTRHTDEFDSNKFLSRAAFICKATYISYYLSDLPIYKRYTRSILNVYPASLVNYSTNITLSNDVQA